MAPAQIKEKRDPICTVKDCGKPHKAKGYCGTHLARWYDTGSVELSRTDLPCGMTGCKEPRKTHSGRGWCRRHYQNWWRHGDPLGSGSSARNPERRAAELEITAKIRADLRIAQTMRERGRTRDANFFVAQAKRHGRPLTKLESEYANALKTTTHDHDADLAEVRRLRDAGKSRDRISVLTGMSGSTVNRYLEELATIESEGQREGADRAAVPG